MVAQPPVASRVGRSPVERVAAYRFDDPAGEVGIETMLLRVDGGLIHQIPLTYRAAPLAGADDWLIGTTEHSVLGKRWVYDGCGDPVYVAALASVFFGGVGQADEFRDINGRLEMQEPSMTVVSSGGGNDKAAGDRGVFSVTDGDPTLIVTDTAELAVIRILGDTSQPTGATLTGTWAGQPDPMLLAFAHVR